MLTSQMFRRMALGFEGAVEKSHMGHPDFRANGQIFATLHADAAHGMVKLPPEHQQRFVSDFPRAFAPASGAWGRAGSTIVTSAAVDAETLGEAMTLAWQSVASVDSRPSAIRRRKKRR